MSLVLSWHWELQKLGELAMTFSWLLVGSHLPKVTLISSLQKRGIGISETLVRRDRWWLWFDWGFRKTWIIGMGHHWGVYVPENWERTFDTELSQVKSRFSQTPTLLGFLDPIPGVPLCPPQTHTHMRQAGCPENSIQFWHYLLGDSVKSHRLVFSPTRLPSRSYFRY